MRASISRSKTTALYIVSVRIAIALRETHRVLRPGGSLIVRNPNRWHPLDQFTGLPLLQLLPPHQATLRRASRQAALDGSAGIPPKAVRSCARPVLPT